MDRIGPADIDQAVDTALNQQVTEMKGIEDAGIIAAMGGL